MMAGKKPQVPIVAPLKGVRKDVDSHVAVADMAVDATNVIAFDQSIRPRPALTNEGFGSDEAPTWAPVYAAGDFGVDWKPHAFCQFDDGTILASCRNETSGVAQKFMYSVDLGASWRDTGATHPLSGSGDPVIRWMKVYGDHIYIFARKRVPLGAGYNRTSQTENIYRSATSGFPGAAAWTTIGNTEIDKNDIDSAAYPAPGAEWFSLFFPGRTEVTYDEDNDALVFVGGWYDKLDEHMEVYAWVINDASTTSGSGDIVYIGGSYAAAGHSHNPSGFSWVNGERIVRSGDASVTGSVLGLYGIEGNLLISNDFQWGGSQYAFTDAAEYLVYWKDDWSVNLGGFPEGPSWCLSQKRPVEIGYNNDVIFALQYGEWTIAGGWTEVFQTILLQATLSTIASGDPAFESYAINEELAPEFTTELGHPPFETDEKLVFISAGDLNSSGSAYCITSATSGDHWQRSGYGGPDAGANVALIGFVTANETTDQHLIFNYEDAVGLPIDGLWLMPSSAAPNIHGSPTQIFQMDMDDEDQAIVIGTTQALLRLDRGASVWDRITADHDETVDTGAGGVWTESGDIPPLTVTSDRAEYVSGVTIDTEYGSNHWVFRSIEVQGNTFLLATNGQCYPLAYHPDMEGGFARRMGEVQPTDPNDIPAFDPLDYPAGYLRTGNLAPKAACMAVGANRVLLGNLGISPFGVDVSGFSDCDRGFGLTQTTLLGDTPGPIVSMNEVSALQVAIYKTDAIYHAVAQTEFMGVAAPFRFELSKAGVVGPCSPACVLRNYDGRQIYLGRDGGVYIYDGVAPIDGGRNIRRMVQPYLDPDQLDKCWGMVDYQRKLVWYFFPVKGGIVNRGIVLSTDQGYPWQCWGVSLPVGWNFTTGVDAKFSTDLALEDLPGSLGDYPTETLGSFSSGEQFMLVGRENNLWYTQKYDDDGRYDDDGERIEILVDTGWTNPPGSGGASQAMLDELYHIFNSPDPEMEIQVRVKAQQLGQNVRYSESRNLFAGKTRRKTSHRVSGTRFGVELSGWINRIFSWGGAISTMIKRGER